MLRTKNAFVFQKLALVLGVVLLASCTPTEPDGIDKEGLGRIGDQLQARGDFTGAADFYTRAIQHAPNDVHARKAYAELLEQHGDIEAAAQQYAAALKIAPDDSELLRNYGRTLLKLNLPSEAKQQYQKAIEQDPDDVKALNGLGVSLDYLKQHSAAQAVYRDALDKDPGDITTLGNLGHSYVLSGAYDEAIKLLEPHLHDKGATPAFRQNLAEAYGMRGMDADAERVARMDLNPDQVRHNLAYYRTHRTLSDAGPVLVADLGSFATSAIAQAHAEDIRQNFSDEVEGLSVIVASEVKNIGGTPVFTVRVAGFEKAAKLRAFCASLKKEGEACTARGAF